MGFVVMPDHLHVAFVLEPETPRAGTRSYEVNPQLNAVVGAASRPRSSLTHVMRTFKSYTARKINESLALKGPLWQEAYHDHFVRDRKDFGMRLSYMHGNPVRKGLSQFEDEYEFSTASTKFAHLIDWAWLDGVGTGRGREAAPTGRNPLSLPRAHDNLSSK